MFKTSIYRKNDTFYDIESLANLFVNSFYNPLEGQFTVYLDLSVDEKVLNSNTSNPIQAQLKRLIDQDFEHYYQSLPANVQASYNGNIQRINELRQTVCTELHRQIATKLSRLIMRRIFKVNQHIIHRRNIKHIKISTLIDMIIKMLEIFDTSETYEKPPRFLGFNSQHYDIVMLSKLLGDTLNGEFSRRPIKAVNPITGNYEYQYDQNHNHVLSIKAPVITNSFLMNQVRDLKTKYDFTNDGVATATSLRNFSDQIVTGGKLSAYQLLGGGDHQTSSNGVKAYNEFRNSHQTLDIMIINEKMKHVSLKRISGQTGLPIIESDNLDEANDVIESLFDLTDLLAYNASDIFNEAFLFEFDAYQDPYNQHSMLIERFDQTKYKGRLNSDATSANLIELTLSPDRNDPLKQHDDPYVTTYYPTKNPKMYRVWNEIKDDFQAYLQAHPSLITPLTVESNNQTANVKPTPPSFTDTLQEKFREYFQPQWEKDFPDEPFNKKRFWYNHEDFEYPVQENLVEVLHDTYPEINQSFYDFYNMIVSSNITNKKELVSRLNSIGTKRLLFPVANTPASISVSIGGEHGAYFAIDEAFKANQPLVEYNHALEQVKTFYSAKNTEFETDEEGLLAAKRSKRDGFTHHEPPAIQDLEPHSFTTGTYANPKWKNPKRLLINEELDTQLKQQQADDIKRQGYSTIISTKNRLTKTAVDKFVRVVYAINTIHADVDSLYPTLLTRLHVFIDPDNTDENGHPIDDYAELLKERLKKKHSLPKDAATWSAKDIHNNNIQLGNKLLLNAASGKANTDFDNNIKLDNKIVRMRLCGQLIISTLVYELARHGAIVFSTNTDGVYFKIPNKTKEEEMKIAKKIVDDWITYFNISASPEVISVMVSKDTNNRLEISEKGIKAANGGSLASYRGLNLTKAQSQPPVADHSLVRYLARRDLVPVTGDFDRDFVTKIITDQQAYWISQLKTLHQYQTLYQSWCQDKNLHHLDEAQQQIYQSMTDQLDQQYKAVVDCGIFFQWIFTDNVSKNRYLMPVKVNVIDDHDPENIKEEYKIINHQKTNRIFLTKPEFSNDRMVLITAKKILKTRKRENIVEEPLAIDMLLKSMSLARQQELNIVDEHNKLIPIENKSREYQLAFQKIGHLKPDNHITVYNGNLETIPLNIVENLDLEAYVDIVEENWKLWSEQAVVI